MLFSKVKRRMIVIEICIIFTLHELHAFIKYKSSETQSVVF